MQQFVDIFLFSQYQLEVRLYLQRIQWIIVGSLVVISLSQQDLATIPNKHSDYVRYDKSDNNSEVIVD